MEIDDKKIEQLLGNLESAIGKIGRIDIWLPKAIENAMSGHRGTLDPVNIDRMRREKREEEKHDTEIDNLRTQIEESQKQTQEIRRQTKYLMYAFILACLGFLLNIILQLSPELFGLISKK
ncbi:MAG: hypothetical protein A2259_01675 [Candidatus Moranbacteria bacterium RIFOXYA2_FULL_43_15]|nr:MAG: hypothetical protein A2259_01675 [Candidatus Moranbacteria bacterium RIFOXYA2_FULL_43_15]